MKAAPRLREGRTFATPGGYGGYSNEYRLSLDDSVHATESITDMYGDSEDNSSEGGSAHHSRNNSASSIGTPPYTNPPTPRTPPQPTKQNREITMSENMHKSPTSPSFNNAPPSPTLSDAANHSFPLNDIDYESDPQAVQQELNNLQALRRMSMDVANVANDPDLPAYNFLPPAPTPADSEDDASRLFWVPARLHPELAPKEFKTFVESRVQQIRNHKEEGVQSGLRVESQPSLRRKKSMLSRQIDNSEGKAADHYRDGAEAIRRQRANSGELQLKVADLENVLSTDPSNLVKQLTLSSTERSLTGEIAEDPEDIPIFPAPPGQSLRRSTRTALRRGSLRKGERVAPSRRGTRLAGAHAGEDDTQGDDDTRLKLTKTRTEPIPSIAVTEDIEQPRISQDLVDSPSGYSVNDLRAAVNAVEEQYEVPDAPISRGAERMVRTTSEPVFQASSPAQREAYSHSRHHSQAEQQAGRTSYEQLRSSLEGRPREFVSPPLSPQDESQPLPKRPQLKRTTPLPSATNINLHDVVTAATGAGAPQKPQARRTESAPGLPTAAAKEGGRKSSWAWLMLGSDADKNKEGKKIRRVKSSEKNAEKEKEKEREKERERERDIEQEKANERNHARLDLIQKSIEGVRASRGSIDSVGSERPSLDVLEREREKDKAGRKAGKDEKKDGLFSSIFGGSKKKTAESSSKTKSNANLVVPADKEVKSTTPQSYYYTRFPIHIERAIYRLSHLKLANPRRPLVQQVLLSNFMYAYLAKVQLMQPTNGAQAKIQQQQQQREQQQRQTHQRQQQQQQQQPGQSQAQPPHSNDQPRPCVNGTPQRHQPGQSEYDVPDRNDSSHDEHDDEDYDFEDDGHDEEQDELRIFDEIGSENGGIDHSRDQNYHKQQQQSQHPPPQQQHHARRRNPASAPQATGYYNERQQHYQQQQSQDSGSTHQYKQQNQRQQPDVKNGNHDDDDDDDEEETWVPASHQNSNLYRKPSTKGGKETDYGDMW